ncbi:Subtilisin-like protease [Acorus calamus]|uniref:Subtilisin-like protease n=1 Tax=Acorus calamus TaxID=4465 RepID=A0AAV9CYB6_ACOCL|nr:Subtilisin-like protease [Acorus calamus]
MAPLWAIFSLFTCTLTISTSLTTNTLSQPRKTYIIRVQNDLKPSIFPDVKDWYSSTLKSVRSASTLSASTEYHRDSPIHVYGTVFHGFSAKLSEQEADSIKAHHSVLAVFPDRARQIQTTRSRDFMGLGGPSLRPGGPFALSDYGSNIVIGVLDTGIWPERNSFHDRGLGPIPARWHGACDSGPGFGPTHCNRKLIGARYFPSGYEASFDDQKRGLRPNVTREFRSPRDSDGHGTHTASTAAGRHARGASLMGYAEGTAAGVAPKARIAVYKICWSTGCFDSDVLSAIDRAVEDGVDVISLSVGAGAVPYYYDPIAIGAFGAMEKGVVVSTSAGNDGPGEMTVTNIAPWITTVGAGTIDRTFPADLTLGDGRVIQGVSLYSGDPFPPQQYFPLIYAGNSLTTARSGSRFNSAFCTVGSLDPTAVKGKIVLCERGGVSRVSKGQTVKDAGGAGMIVANTGIEGEGLVADAHVLPALAIGEMGGYAVHSYISSTANPTATFAFHGTRLGVRPAPVVAAFSARGPNAESQYVIKPDLIAPGVNILAAWPDEVGPSGLPSDGRRTEFNILSGTSMACPHVSGLAALLKGAHPDWSPAAIKSAMMTTAYVRDNSGRDVTEESHGKASSVWDLGSGHVDPVRAIDPGLVYDLTVEDYVRFLCGSQFARRYVRTIARREMNCTDEGGKAWDLNYPSISMVFVQSTAVMDLEAEVTRTVTNVGEGEAIYTVSLVDPAGARLAVDPARLEFARKGERRTFVVRISAGSLGLPRGNSRTSFGSMTWQSGRRSVRSPVAVTWQQPF